jgi:excisionase family DNA binding protein
VNQQAIAIIPQERIDTLERKIDSILSFIEKMTEKTPPRVEYTVNELAKLKGYSRTHIRRMIQLHKIPHTYKGRDLIVKKEDAGLIKEKVTQNS